MKTVAIIGVGLIGGSLGMALRRSKEYRVLGIGRNPMRLKRARRLGAVDSFSTRLGDAGTADVIVICSPLETFRPLLRHLQPHLKAGTIVTDAGSVKGSILREAARFKWPRGVSFVGAHPLAGSHKTGVQAARPDLFQGAVCVLTPLHKAGLPVVAAMWKTAGARTLVMKPQEHDRAVALTSHLPHLMAHALVHVLLGSPNRKRAMALLAGSFRDVTRVASSDADQWAQILRANAADVHQALRAFQKVLSTLDRNLSRPALKSLLRKSSAFRRPLFNGI